MFKEAGLRNPRTQLTKVQIEISVRGRRTEAKAKPDRSIQPIGKPSGVGGRTVTLDVNICPLTSVCSVKKKLLHSCLFSLQHTWWWGGSFVTTNNNCCMFLPIKLWIKTLICMFIEAEMLKFFPANRSKWPNDRLLLTSPNTFWPDQWPTHSFLFSFTQENSVSDLLTVTKSMFRRAEHTESEDGSTKSKPRKLNGEKNLHSQTRRIKSIHF